MSSQLVLATKKNVVPYGSRTNAQFGCGNVSAQAVFAGIDPSGVAVYAVQVTNNSEHALVAVVRFGTRRASELTVAPFSVVESLVPRPQGARHDDRAIVDVRGTGLALSIDAPASVPALKLRRLGSVAAAACAAVGSVALAAGLFAASKVQQPSPVASIAQKVNPAPVVHHAAPVLAREEAVLDPLHITPAAVTAGAPLTVRYGAHNAHGDVWLIDMQGKVWARTAADATGSAALKVPQEAAGRDLRVVVSAHRGAQQAQVSANVLVLPDASNVAQTQPPAQTPNDAPPPASVTVSPQRVPSGGSIHVRFAPGHGEALVAITDQGGSILEEVDVEPGRDSATLRAPEVGAVTTYDVVVTITKGNAQDQTVKPVTVVP